MIMLTGKKIILFGAGEVGIRALIYFGFANVECFCDTRKTGYHYGKRIISPDELSGCYKNFDVVIAVTAFELRYEIEDLLTAKNVPFVNFQDVTDPNVFEPNPSIEKYRDMYKGRRCFIIGNGPSLTAEDLTTLEEHNEITFACNAIYKIFDKTKWRPDFFFCIDDLVYQQHFDHIKSQIKCPQFMRNKKDHTLSFENTSETTDEINTFYLNLFCNIKSIPKKYFSRFVYTGTTVVFPMIQAAEFMGFREAFLLGVDCSIMSEKHIDRIQHFYTENTIVTKQEQDEKYYGKLFEFYRIIRDSLTDDDFHIYNASRFSMLDVFPRINFDDLFEDEIC
jgi:hypothetical protein